MSEEEILKEYIDIINALYIVGQIKDEDGKVTNILKLFLNLYNKEKEKNKKLENILITIRNKTKPHIIWQDAKTQSYNLKGTTKQEIYKVFSEIRSLVKGEYIFLDNEKAIDKLLEE